MTIAFLNKRKVKYIAAAERMPKSLDAALMDFSIWGILKRRLQKRKLYTLIGLKKALKNEWNKLDQNCINKTPEGYPGDAEWYIIAMDHKLSICCNHMHVNKL